jgi:NAD(P)-dependent dehydrogenase (short-subunit alcohol dehydrogenase family)
MTARVALITGGAGGIGMACAEMFAAAGLQVALVDRNPDVHQLAAALGEKHNVPTIGFVVDLAREDDVTALARDALAWKGRIDILVNNAGIHPKQPDRKFVLEEVTNAHWAEVFAINLTAPFILTRELLPEMKTRGWGRIVNNASTSGRTGRVNGSTPYTASKHGLIGLTRSSAIESGQSGVTVNAIAPGPVLTQRIMNAPEYRSGKAQMVRYGMPEEAAAVINFLVSDAAAYVNGAVYDVNGGTLMA